MRHASAGQPDGHAERDASFTVIGVTALSTLAMIIYPIAVSVLGLDHRAAGVFLGGTIHDVAQVVGAGYSLSPETGDTATIVKLGMVMLIEGAILAVTLGVMARIRGQRRAQIVAARAQQATANGRQAPDGMRAIEIRPAP